jgi:pimeloyl-ACP methyl ester carboxylesterase
VHRGFAKAARAVLPELVPWVEDRAASRLILAGHSLGGALATLAATVLRPTLVVTLGAPRVGDAAFAATVPEALVRFVGCCDAVTDLPPPIGYTHPRAWTYLTRDAQRMENPPSSLVRGDRFRARLHYFARHAWTKGAVLVRDLADHAPINYARSFFT